MLLRAALLALFVIFAYSTYADDQNEAEVDFPSSNEPEVTMPEVDNPPLNEPESDDTEVDNPES